MTTTISMPTAAPEAPRPVRDFKLWMPAWLARQPEWLRIGGFLVIVMLASAAMRTIFLNGQFWMDEAIAVGISSHSLSAIPGILRMDGSPPLYYMILHVWMQMFGNSAIATHSLSLVFGTLTIPIGYWGGASLVSKRCGLMAAILFATSAFLTSYSQETRMYALMALEGEVASIAFIHAFVFRRRKYVPVFAVFQALMLYTHAWALFYGAGSFIAVILVYRISAPAERENFVKDVLAAYIGAGVLFLPWVPNFIYQSIHTAAPWDSSPQLGAPVQLSKDVLGGDSITAAVVLAALVGISDLVLRRNRGTKLARTLFILFAIPTFTLILAWVASQVTPAWSPRYFAPIVPPILLLLALGMSRSGIIGAGALIFAVIFLSHPAAYAPAYKSDLQYLSYEMGPQLHKGDLVMVGQPEQVPLNYYYLPGGLRFTSTIGPVKDPSYMNWVNALTRYQQAKPSKVLPPMLNALKAGQQVLFVRPLTEGNVDWNSPWTRLIRRRSAQWGAILTRYVKEGKLAVEDWAPHNYVGSCCVADSALLYKKIG
jgi:uncharacterized membrane protein (UPF0136 family)